MKELIQLMSNIDPTQLTKREQEFLHAVIHEDWNKESDLAEMLWPGDLHQGKYFREFKGKLLNRVVGVVFDEKGTSPYSTKLIECYRMYSAVQILGSTGQKKEYIYFAERLFKMATRYEVTEICASIADTLHHHYGTIAGNPNETKKYFKLSEEYDEILFAERKVKRMFVNVAQDFAKSRKGKSDTLDRLAGMMKDLNLLSKKYSSYRFLYFTYYLRCINAQLNNQLEELENICQAAILDFQNKKYSIPNSVYFLFGFQLKASSALEVGDFEFAKQAIRYAKEAKYFNPYNISVCLIYQATIAFHTKDYDLLNNAIEESAELDLSEAHRQNWIIIRAYAHLLDIIPDPHFRLSKFVNEVGGVAKDKLGLNVSILIIEILHHLRSAAYGKLIDRQEALDKYNRRYLRGKYERGECILNMLLTIIKEDFQVKAIREKVREKGYWEQLRKDRMIEDSEIVPFETIWNEALVVLQEEREKV